MVFQTSPGIVTTEVDQQLIVSGSATSTGAFVGSFAWGPVDEIVTINNENSLVSFYQKPNDDTYRSFLTCADFLSYSDDLRVVRVVGDNARNAAAGGDGTGLTITTTVVNGAVASGSIVAGGTKYIVGDVVLVESSLVPARFKVTETNDGVVTGISLLHGGTGQVAGTGKATVIVGNVLVKNSADMNDDLYAPDIIARYPGVLGNSLEFSIARASEFDNWAYKSRFGIAPSAKVVKFEGDNTKLAFDLPATMTTLPSDAIVNVNGYKRTAGTNPGQYGVASGKITFVAASETFAGDGKTNSYTLTNAQSLDTTGATVTVDGTVSTAYDGVGEVPFGSHRLVGNKLEIGVNSEYLSGDGATVTFTIPGLASAANARIWVDGSERDVLTTATPTAGKVSVTSSGGNTTIKFFAGEAPKAGNLNINLKHGYVASSKNTVVSYGAPHAKTDAVKIFYDQTEAHAVVTDSDGEWTGTKYSLLERFEFLSLNIGDKYFDGSAKYYKEALNRRSQYIRVASDILVFGDKQLTGGVDANKPGTDITPGIHQAGFALFRNKEDVSIHHVICGDADISTLIYVISNLTEYRKDCVAYISPMFSDVVNNRGREVAAILSTRNSLPSTTYAHMDSTWRSVYDRYNDKLRWIPSCGISAGIYAQTHDTTAPWFSGAGLNRGIFKNTLKLSFAANQTERDQLYAAGVNPVAFFRGDGAVLWGDKTLSNKPSAFDRMNVRWLFIVLRTSIEEIARYTLFEFNDESTRNQFKNAIHPFLRDVQGGRGIQDFKIVCDGSNNTGSVIDRNEFVGDIYIKPAKSINFIQLNFISVNSEVDFNEIILN